MLRPLGILCCLTAATAFAGSFTGPTSVYYLSDGTSMYMVQGLNLLSTWTVAGTAGRDLPMAVDTQIRTDGRSPNDSGALYDLNGNYLGTQYTNNGYATGGLDIWDGTTDGTHNYTVSTVCDFCNSQSSLIQTGLDWSNPVVLFSIGNGYDSLGVTYDSSNNSLWVSNWNGGTNITNFALDGTVLSQFSAGFGQIGALALDPVDGTLWATTYGSNTLFQFDKSGTLLQSGTVTGLNSTSLWSGEMSESVVATGNAPEPETWPLLMVGIAAIAIGRRYRRAVN